MILVAGFSCGWVVLRFDGSGTERGAPEFEGELTGRGWGSCFPPFSRSNSESRSFASLRRMGHPRLWEIMRKTRVRHPRFVLPTLSTIEFKKQVLCFAQEDGAPSSVGEHAKNKGAVPAQCCTGVGARSTTGLEPGAPMLRGSRGRAAYLLSRPRSTGTSSVPAFPEFQSYTAVTR